ncbi:MAG: hypothetical protein ABIH37_04665 [archaeon]
MKIKRKKGIDKVKITHNKSLLYVIIILIILFIILVFITVKSFQDNKDDDDNIVVGEECVSDLDCVKAECCHASSCISASEKPECGEIFCTDECAPDTMDCGQGSCKCINSKCEAVID